MRGDIATIAEESISYPYPRSRPAMPQAIPSPTYPPGAGVSGSGSIVFKWKSRLPHEKRNPNSGIPSLPESMWSWGYGQPGAVVSMRKRFIKAEHFLHDGFFVVPLFKPSLRTTECRLGSLFLRHISPLGSESPESGLQFWRIECEVLGVASK